MKKRAIRIGGPLRRRGGAVEREAEASYAERFRETVTALVTELVGSGCLGLQEAAKVRRAASAREIIAVGAIMVEALAKFEDPPVASRECLAGTEREYLVTYPANGATLGPVNGAHIGALRGLTTLQVARRRTSHTVAAMSSTDSASSQPPSMTWKGQNRLAGW